MEHTDSLAEYHVRKDAFMPSGVHARLFLTGGFASLITTPGVRAAADKRFAVGFTAGWPC